MMISNRIMGLCWGNEITWNQVRSLMNQLVKGMLSIGTWFPPNDWASTIVYFFAITTYVFSVALHISLLEVGGKTM